MLDYDANLSAPLEFGGYDGALFSNSTWKFAGGGWSRVATRSAPTARESGGMVFDAADNYTVLFGGYNGSVLGDTWKFQNGGWSELRPSSSPSARAWVSMAYDTSLKEVVLFGGSPAYGVALNDTWTFSNGSWSNVTASVSGAPTGRTGAAMAFDGADGYVLLYGGTNGPGVVQNDTWALNNSTWSRISVTGTPGPIDSAGMAYDAYRQIVQLYGGADQLGGPGTFTYRAGVWTEYYPLPAPAQDGGMGMAYDPADEAVFVTGGYGGYGNQSFFGFVNDTWEIAGTRWTLLEGQTQPGGIDGESMAYDAADGYLLMFGGQAMCYVSCSEFGSYEGDTWALSGTNWTLERPAASPSDRMGASMAFDGATNETILFGGSTWSGAYSINDTWEYRAGNWTRLHPSVSPPARWGADLVYDAAVNALVLFGGTDGGTAFNDTWEFSNGSWSELTTATAPSGRAWAMASYDAEIAGVLLFGGCRSVYGGFYGCAGSNSNETWTFVNGSWARVGSAYTPPAMAGVAMAAGPSSEPVVMFGGGSGVATWFFRAGNWSVQNLTPGPGYRVYSALTYDPNDGLFWSFGGAAGPSGALWDLSPAFAVSVAVTERPFADVGQSVVFQAGAVGVLGVATYAWSGLPGCPSENLSTLPCLVESSGQFSVVVTVLTTGGENATSPPLDFAATGPPQLGLLTVAPNPAFVGESMTISVNVSGGAPPVSLQWTGLPTGCLSSNATVLACSPSVAGGYGIRVLATDAAGVNVTSGLAAIVVDTPPSVAAPTASRPSADVGQVVTFTTVFTGGAGETQVVWTGLPPGCLSANASTVECTPTGASNGTLDVRDTYAPGLTAVSNGTAYTVYADPTITAPTVSAAVVVQGASETFSVQTTPGSGNDTISWGGLPGPCSGAAVAREFACLLPAGNFTVSATWTDSNGFVATSASTHVEVLAPENHSTPEPPVPSSPGPSVLLYVLAGVGVAVVAAAVGIVLLRGRRGRSE